MLSATNSDLNANDNQHVELATSSQLPSTTYLCTSCQVTFQNGQDQRIHMKEPWHVYNIKRRIASLPPIRQDSFVTKIEKKVDNDDASISHRSISRSSDDGISDNEIERNSTPFQCLFCNRAFTSDDAGFAMNLDHMRISHGMSIPDPDMVTDLQSFVSYLATEVREWHECLYCGATKSTTLSIQSHMRDKGHCLLNFDREPELVEFWESPRSVNGINVVAEQESSTYLSPTEMRFPSGKIISSKDAALVMKKEYRKRCLAAPTMSPLPSGSEEKDTETSSLTVGGHLAFRRQLACREEMSILGVTMQQRTSLVLAEKKAQRSEAVARRAREWAYAKGANSQKFDQVDNQMKWGKQNHKLLPR